MRKREALALGVNLRVATPAVAEESLRVSVLPWTKWSTVEPAWRELWMHSTPRTMFMSPEWVSVWLEVFGDELAPDFVLIRCGDAVVGCCSLVRKREHTLGLPLNRLYLNTAGERVEADLCTEYNEFLCHPSYAHRAVTALCEYMSHQRWDELVINGAAMSRPLNILRAQWNPRRERVTTKQACFVDLDAIRTSGGNYLDELSANTREQIRRSRRWYEQHWGPLEVRIAECRTEARSAFDALTTLHQRRWTSKGQPGAFASPQFRAFHTKLIDRLVPVGRVHLATVRAGERPLGVLYNFVTDNRVAFYQSGFAYGQNNREKPGLVTHSCVLDHYLAGGYAEYDFMGRDSRYKHSLAPHSRERHWLVLERASVKMQTYAWLRMLKRALTGARTN